MSSLPNSPLDIGKLKSGAIRPQIVDFKLDNLFEELRVKFTGVAGKHGLRLGWRLVVRASAAIGCYSLIS
jgi:hypothetical protein